MNLLVTGGCGFIGSNFIHLLLTSGEATFAPVRRLVNLDLLTYAGNPDNLAHLASDPRYHFVQGDISDEALVDSLLSQYACDAVIHFAAESHVDRSIDSPEPFFLTNTLGTLRLANAARRHWQHLASPARERFRFLHVSTDEVYGSLAPEAPAFTEQTPYAPNSPYAASKAASDFIVRAAHHTYGLPTLVTHCSNNYGPCQFPEKLIPLMLLNALDGKPLPIYGDGMHVRDWLYVEDHCHALWQVLLRGTPGQTYNIGGLHEMANLHLIDTLCELLDTLHPRAGGQPYGSLKTFVKDRPGHDRRYAIDCTRITRELGWAPRESFESGLRKTIQWYLDHPDWSAAITQKTYARQRLGQG